MFCNIVAKVAGSWYPPPAAVDEAGTPTKILTLGFGLLLAQTSLVHVKVSIACCAGIIVAVLPNTEIEALSHGVSRRVRRRGAFSVLTLAEL